MFVITITYLSACQPRKDGGHVFVCKVYRYCLLLRFSYWNLELFRQCGIFFILLQICIIIRPIRAMDARSMKLVELWQAWYYWGVFDPPTYFNI